MPIVSHGVGATATEAPSRQFALRPVRERRSCPRPGPFARRRRLQVLLSARSTMNTHSTGWDIIEPTIIELEKKMRDAENEPHEGYENWLLCGFSLLPARERLRELGPSCGYTTSALAIYSKCSTRRRPSAAICMSGAWSRAMQTLR